MRIDEWLHSRGYFESRNKAKIAVKKGLVLVNGERVKPSHNVTGNERIDIFTGSYPAGYYKLRDLDSICHIFEGNEVVLDIGSSAGGFLLYASEKARMVFGIEYSREFEGGLRKIEGERENVRVFIADAFTFDTSILPDLDLILCDLTLEPEDAMKALRRFLPKLREEGKVVFVSKGKKVIFYELEVVNVVKAIEKKEWYYFLRKIH